MLVLGLTTALTFGITGVIVAIWAIYDLICVCINKLKPADGSEYVK